MKIFMAFMAVTMMVLASFFTYGVDLTLKTIIVFALTAITVSPVIFAMYKFFALLFSIYKVFAKNLAIKIAKNKKLEDTIASHLYFIGDMGPSVSSVSVVALFVSTEASVVKLVALFVFGFILKYVSRKMRDSFYRVIRKVQGVDNDRVERG